MLIGEATRLHISVLGWAGPNDPAAAAADLARRVPSDLAERHIAAMFYRSSRENRLGGTESVAALSGRLLAERLGALVPGDAAPHLDAINAAAGEPAFVEASRLHLGLLFDPSRPLVGADLADCFANVRSLLASAYDGAAQTAPAALADVHGTTRDLASQIAFACAAGFLAFQFDPWRKAWQRALADELRAESDPDEAVVICDGLAVAAAVPVGMIAGALTARIATDAALQLFAANDADA